VIWAVTVVVAATAGTRPASGQAAAGPAAAATGLPDASFGATRGIFVPGGVRAGDADPTAVELNPGQLSLQSGGQAVLVGNLWRRGAAMPGRGVGLFVGAPVWGGGGIGLGLQGIGSSRPGGSGTDLSGHTKLVLGYGIGGRTFGIGATWAHLFDGGAIGGLDTFDAGISFRPVSGLAAALVLEDFARPRVPGAAGAGPVVPAGFDDRLPRRWAGELALRPMGIDRLEIAAGALHLGGDPWSKVSPRFRLAARVGAAWHLLVALELDPRRADVAPAPGTVSSGTDWRATLGATLDLDHGSLGLAARRSFTPQAAGGENWGASGVWRVSAEKNSPSASIPRAARISLEGVQGDREFLTLALRLRQLARDSSIAAIFLKVEGLELGLGRIEELRDAIAELRGRGKKVVAYLTNASMREMYLASACDRVVMHPAGGMTFSGLSQVVTFYKGAMDRLGVSVDLVRIAEFKGAMEPYVMTGQSEPVRQNRNQLLDDVFARILSGVAAGRGRGLGSTPGAGAEAAAGAAAANPTQSWLDQLIAVGSFSPAEALRVGLVDAVRDQSDAEQALRELLGRRAIEIRDLDLASVRAPRWSRRRVAVILIDGTITEGASRHLPFDLGSVAGADTLVDALDECRRDPDIRAVVLRVNTPGGSAFSSDVIARAVLRVRAAGKPVVVSMGDVAASGGYYVSAPADVIFAEPSTTTGSIGIFGFKVDVARLLSMLSINVEVLRRGPHADQEGPYRPWTPEERQIAERKIRYLYDLFVATVASGRKSRGLTPERVDHVGRGHVWTGAQAQVLGLVDELGGVLAAIDRAGTLGGVPVAFSESPELVLLPRSTKSVLQAVAGLARADTAAGEGEPSNDRSPSSTSLTPPLRAALRLAAPYLFGAGEGVEARLPFDLELR
jgi:protease-4